MPGPGLANDVAACCGAKDDEEALFGVFDEEAVSAPPEPSPGPHAASIVVADATANTVATDETNDRFFICYSRAGSLSAHSFAAAEETFVKRAKTFASMKFRFQSR
ncbi:hypothetical protein [Paraburkholderia caballeronis]|uniref:hypothetical protein n=1 Tax=Paraburkholderia caballeronis TaxID=416943 RepID=UPI001065BC8D|nr:hypothetical protein [Paraburkholderia caballeronis]